MFEATITAVRKKPSTGETVIELEPYGRGLKQLLIISPPPKFDECVGIDIRVESDAVFIGDVLWAKRNGPRHMQLVAKRK